MKTALVELQSGWKVGGKRHRKVLLREPTVGDLLEAREAGGEDDLRVGLELLARQVQQAGGEDLAATVDLLRALPLSDLQRLEEAADQLAGEAAPGKP